MGYYASIRKDEYPTFVSTWTGLEEIMLSEISQAERVNYHMVYLPVEHKEKHGRPCERKGSGALEGIRWGMNHERL